MKPDLESSRSFAMVLAHRAVRDIRRDGFRQLRNYVDMCALLARRPDLKGFFDRAQTTLQRTDSLYYSLVHKLVEQVDEEAICTVGINLGLDSIVACAAEHRSGTGGGSWFNAGLCSAPGLDAAVSAAEANGSYAWALYADGDVPQETAALFTAHPNSVFFVLVDPQDIDAQKLEQFKSCPNAVTLICLHQPELVPEACRAAHALRDKKMFYGFLAELDEESAAQAIDPDWLAVLAQYALFCIYARKPDMTPETSHTLYRQIVSSRMDAVSVPVLLLDWEEDLRYVSRMVSPGTAPGQCVPEGESFPLDLRCGETTSES